MVSCQVVHARGSVTYAGAFCGSRSRALPRRVPKGATLFHEGDSRRAEHLDEEAYVLVKHPRLGSFLRRKATGVEQESDEGLLSKDTMREILEKSSNAQELVIPLEAKTWSRAEFELFVMSGGAVRPKWCSVPDQNAAPAALSGRVRTVSSRVRRQVGGRPAVP